MNNESQAARPQQSKERAGTPPARTQYETPRITRMSEKDVLKSFQVTSAAASWWGM